MEDDKLKSLFSNFEPELSSDFLFMNKLQRNLNSVELIKQHTAEVRSRSRKAVAIAAIVGFIVGFLFSLSLPYLTDAVSNWQLTLPSESVMNVLLIISQLLHGSLLAAHRYLQLSIPMKYHYLY